MPKPVLSDSLFNADDVATAILAEANLQVTNSDLGVNDRSSKVTFISGLDDLVFGAYSFNGFFFIHFHCKIPDASPPNNAYKICEINDADFYPITTFNFPTVSYQGDTGLSFRFESNGEGKIISFSNPGASSFHLTINGFFRYT